jgi:hypothetical protein
LQKTTYLKLISGINLPVKRLPRGVYPDKGRTCNNEKNKNK